MITPDPSEARRFVAALTGSANTPLRLRYIHPDRTKLAEERYGTIDALWPETERYQTMGYGIYYCVSKMPAELVDPITGAARMANDADAIAVRAVPIDFDKGMPDWEWHTPPSLIVRTSVVDGIQKGQALWLGSLPLDQFKPTCERLIAHYTGIGFEADKAVSNLSRVLRLPGSLNTKTDPPQLVTFEDTGARGSGLDGLPELPPPKPRSEATGKPVPFEYLKQVLYTLDPNEGRSDWLKDVWRGARTNTPDATAEQRFELVDQWSKGGKEYKGTDDVRKVWDDEDPDREGPTVDYGGLWKRASDRGFKGPPNPPANAVELMAQHVRLPGQCHRAADMLKQKPSPLREIIPGLVERGVVTFLSGPGGSMKSRLALQLGLCVDSSLPVWGRPVERATCLYLSYEDHYEEVMRRLHAAAKRLGVTDTTLEIWDMVGLSEPLAIVGDTVELQPFHNRLMAKLARISGPKFLVVDSTYNALRFTANAKVNEASVQMGIGVLTQICQDADATILSLWHPSQAGQDRGSMDGWSVAWGNVPRARLSIQAVKDMEGTFSLKVEKRNNAPRPKDPITLHWSDGILLPLSEATTAEQRAGLRKACVEAALRMAARGLPLNKRDTPPKVALDWIGEATGHRPTTKELRDELTAAATNEELSWQPYTTERAAGFYPADEQLRREQSLAAKKAAKAMKAGGTLMVAEPGSAYQ